MKQNTLRRAAALALAAGLTLACGLPAAAAAPNPDPGKAVIDTADILSKNTENYITDLSVALQESCGAQIGVYTVDTIGNYTMEGYTYELANAWGLGDADKDNGIVLVLAPGEDDYRAMCGTGLETQFTVPMLQTILDENLLPSWEEGDYDTGAKQTVRAMGRQLCTIYGLSIDLDDPAATVTAAAASGPVRRGGGFPFGAIVLLLLVLVVVLAIIFAPRGPTRPMARAFSSSARRAPRARPGPRVRRATSAARPGPRARPNRRARRVRAVSAASAVPARVRRAPAASVRAAVVSAPAGPGAVPAAAASAPAAVRSAAAGQAAGKRTRQTA